MLSRMEEDLEAGRSYATIAATFIRNPITSLEQKEDREEDNASYEASTESSNTFFHSCANMFVHDCSLFSLAYTGFHVLRNPYDIYIYIDCYLRVQFII